MSMLDGIMGQLSGPMGQQVASSLAAKVGISPQMAQMAMAALMRAHPQPGDTVAQAANDTGLPTGVLGQIMSHLGGEGGLGQLSGMLGGAGGDTAGAPAPEAESGGMGGLEGMLGGLLGGLR